jgi:hypothetical protein
MFTTAAAARPPPLLCAPLIRRSRAFVNVNGPSPFIKQLESKPVVMPFGLNTPRDRPPRELLATLPGYAQSFVSHHFVLPAATSFPWRITEVSQI